MTKTKILFVDDERNILEGLKRMFRRMRDQWDMKFAESGQEALALIEQDPVDVVISDMRMPGMDGAELLEKIEQLHPETIRIVLSGQCDEETAFRAVRSSHQFMSKPCDSGLLNAVITRAMCLRSDLKNSDLQATVTGLRALPPLPEVFHALEKELRSSIASTNSIAELIGRDITLSSKILQVSNSAFFGIGRNVSSVQQAVNILGTETIRSLVLVYGLFKPSEENSHLNGLLGELTRQALQCANLAKGIAANANLDQGNINHAFTAGLLHDLGRLVLAVNYPDQYQEIWGQTGTSCLDRIRTERALFQSNHGMIGAYLLNIWKLPDPVVEAIAYHHTPNDSASNAIDILTAVHVAQALIEDGGAIDHDYLERIGAAAKLDEWQNLHQKLSEPLEMV